MCSTASPTASPTGAEPINLRGTPRLDALIASYRAVRAERSALDPPPGGRSYGDRPGVTRVYERRRAAGQATQCLLFLIERALFDAGDACGSPWPAWPAWADDDERYWIEGPAPGHLAVTRTCPCIP